MTQLNFGLIGHNISYSLSPKIFELIFTLRKRRGQFEVMDFPEIEFESKIDTLRQWDGFSVTIPYKERILPFVDKLSDDAQTIGAVNSIHVVDGHFSGYNTDTEGFAYPLKKLAINPDKILVIGAGGAARAVIHSLSNLYPGRGFTVAGRNEVKINKLISSMEFNKSISSLAIKLIKDIDINEVYELIVNCTPAGGGDIRGNIPLPKEFAFKDCMVCYDLNYRPAKTLILEKAEKAGSQVLNGIQMLICQAVESYKIWSGDEFSMPALCEDIFSKLNIEGL